MYVQQFLFLSIPHNESSDDSDLNNNLEFSEFINDVDLSLISWFIKFPTAYEGRWYAKLKIL